MGFLIRAQLIIIARRSSPISALASQRACQRGPAPPDRRSRRHETLRYRFGALSACLSCSSSPRDVRARDRLESWKFRPHLSHAKGARRNCSMGTWRSEEHTSELQSRSDLVCRLLLEKKKKKYTLRFDIPKSELSLMLI